VPSAADVNSVVRDALKQFATSGEMKAILPRLEMRVCATIEKYYLSQTPAASAGEIKIFVEGLRLEELCLVVRCESGDEAAWRELVERFTPTVQSAARRASVGEAESEELGASVWAELYGFRSVTTDDETGANRKGKLGYYSGCGSLGGWLRAIVAQLAVDRHRQTRRFVQCEDDTEIERLGNRHAIEAEAAGDGAHPGGRRFSSASITPEELLARRETSELLRHTLLRCIAELDAEDELLLKLYYVDELRLRDAGAVLGVHEATASRRLAAAHKKLRERATTLLRDEHGMTPDHIAAFFQHAARESDVDLRELLRSPDASP
jgi:RNA polymerase sigma factor (sigma-70 family)